MRADAVQMFEPFLIVTPIGGWLVTRFVDSMAWCLHQLA
ncbi:MAG: hypothetical protein ETSY2_07630 [Candidatus Entotheonella gemina]|uniref:Uncharacterized protein n=1 Tax=Candidatus Entotheonella gemina TaxID=1429439 RepID=W4MEH5_9BACT|nr:MAG: hypothetical protein ETSY2_07630 [Candidatus Entotheonella gemina]